MRNICCIIVAAGAFAGGSTAGATSFINGSFEATSNGLGIINYEDTQATDWSVPNGGYTFIFDAAAADGGGVPNYEYAGGMGLWSTGNGGLNTITASPSGGNFIAQDGVFELSPIQQAITGLTSGQTYNVGFYYGGAQQDGWTGDTTSQWRVTLGNSATQSTSVTSVVSHGFSGWLHQSFSFTADDTTDVLSFSALGSGAPAFALLDGVTFGPSGVPEPAAWTLMILGVGAVGGLARRRRAAPPQIA
jgi:hypothetical protein